MQQTLDEVDVRQHHAAAAVPLEAELGERLTLGAALDQEREVRVPLVADDLAAAEAPDGDNLREPRDLPCWRRSTKKGEESA